MSVRKAFGACQAIHGARTKFDAREPAKAPKPRAARGSYAPGSSSHDHRP